MTWGGITGCCKIQRFCTCSRAELAEFPESLGIVYDWKRGIKDNFKNLGWAIGNEGGSFTEMGETQEVRGGRVFSFFLNKENYFFYFWGRVFSKVGFGNVKLRECHHSSR